MKNLLIILKLLVLTLFVAQNPDTTILKKTDDSQKVEKPESVEKEIDYLLKENAIKIEEIKAMKIKNEIEIQKIQQLEHKKKSLLNSISSNLDKLLKKNKVIYVKPEKLKSGELTSLKTDSTCISYKRKDIFSKSKCSQWEYYSYIIDSKNNKIIIK